MKIRALKSFEGIRDIERDTFPKAGDVWEVSEERANFLKEHGVIEFVEEEKVEVQPEIIKTNDEMKVKKDNVEVVVNKNEITKQINKLNKNKKHSKK